RDYLTANVFQLNHSGSYSAGRHFLLWGAGIKEIQVDDQMLEWERRDSAGFSLPFDTSAIHFAKNIHADNDLSYWQTTAFVQDNILLSKAHNMTLNVGLRGNYNFLNKEFILSPRLQFAFQPDWQKDIVFRFATGLYA